MKHLPALFPAARSRIIPPVCVALGPPWPVTQLVGFIKADHPDAAVTCFQMDTFAAMRLREKLAQENLAPARSAGAEGAGGPTVDVVTGADLWDLPGGFRTVVFPAAGQADRELKLDMVEQGYHVLADGGLFVTLSEYEKDSLFAKAMKRQFGKCGESPTAEHGMAFWSARTGDRPRRRHAQTFHARVGDGPSMRFETWPGTFSYGQMDNGSRAMLEVTELNPGEHVLDMGCGNGSVGCLASTLAADVRVTFIDSNARATALTAKNVEANAVPNTTVVLHPDLGGLSPGGYDVILANPPYYANSEVARVFIASARDLLTPGGRFYLVTKMPVQTIPEVVESFGEVESVENRGYTVLTARA